MRGIADFNQANIFAWIYDVEISDPALARTIDNRKQIIRYVETSDRSRATFRIECDNDHFISDNPPGRWQLVQDIPYSPDQDPNRPMRNSRRNQNALAPGTVVEYTDMDNRMRENAASDFCPRNVLLRAAWHFTPERDSQGQVEPRFVLTICDVVANDPPYLRSMNAFLASSERNGVLSAGSINLFAEFRSLLFLYMLYQLPPLGKQMTVLRHGYTVGVGDLASIIELGPGPSQNHAGAFAWYDLLAGFADRGYVFKISAAREINNVVRIAGFTPERLEPALTGPLTYDPRYVYSDPDD